MMKFLSRQEKVKKPKWKKKAREKERKNGRENRKRKKSLFFTHSPIAFPPFSFIKVNHKHVFAATEFLSHFLPELHFLISFRTKRRVTKVAGDNEKRE